MQAKVHTWLALFCLTQVGAWHFNADDFDVFDPNFGAKLNQQIQNEVGGMLQNVQQQVSNTMLPITANMIKMNMAQGVGGATVVNVAGKTVIVRDYSRMFCHGNVRKSLIKDYYQVSCDGRSEPLDQNYPCLPQSWSRVGDTFCFGNNVLFQCAQNSCTCSGGTMVNLRDLQKQCGDNFAGGRYIRYDYYPDASMFNHVQIPNPNPYVVCDNKDAGHCEWYGGFPWM